MRGIDIINNMNENAQKILVVEDDANIRELIKWNLLEDNYDCICAEDGGKGIELAKRVSPDLILLDLMLPVQDGFDVVKTLRMEGVKSPIIILTAKKDEIDKIIGLELGADDYITKPFSVRELKARIRAVLRRYRTENANTNNDEEHKGKIFEIGELVIDIPRHEVEVNGASVALTLKEFELLSMLAENRGIVLTREQLLENIWGYEYLGDTRTVDVHIRYLRRKLAGAGNLISTVRGLGYKLL